MNASTIRSFHSPCLEDEIFGDLSTNFADKPLFRYSFPIEEGEVEGLLTRFKESLVRVYRYRTEAGLTNREAVLRFDSDGFVFIRDTGNYTLLVYSPTAEKAEALEKLMLEAVPTRLKKEDSPYFYMIRKDSCNSYSAQKINNTAPGMDEEGLRLSYGEDCPQWIADFSKQTQAKLGGITILDGPPGTGKSTLITQLMRQLYKTHTFYVLSVAQHEYLSDPNLVEFWQEQTEAHPNEVKVIVIEDSEKILLQRRSDNNEAVSALLNIGDGLLGQMLKVHILCTLNQGMESMDPAIIRPGRLRSYRHVGYLSQKNALLLAAKHKLPFVPEQGRDKYTLAEVFNQEVYQPAQRNRGCLGFHVVPGFLGDAENLTRTKLGRVCQ